ncbi:hypothetical protein [Polaribacter ponticola]|uniref:DUF2130 domain-containing protein n=1 Tax=Polaribacter ponticola TaxID=2978475 RepID=A0ABT5S8L4_9FLAO|nr:hypothetical protein [Polaribacter sp. MSW5]MDD7914418.1 hypothetical protein [Polaribacter sp. MSW5]
MNKNTTVNCPNCNEVFKVDESVYTDIVKQVRDQQFQEELKSRLENASKEKKSALQLKESELNISFQKQLTEKQREIDLLKAKSKTDLIQEVSKKETTIKDLEARLRLVETEKNGFTSCSK